MDVTFFTEDDTDKIVLLYISTGTAADITMVRRRRIAGPTNMRDWSMFWNFAHRWKHLCTAYTQWALQHSGLGIRSFQKNATFSRSFAFFSKERNILCILLRSL